MPRSYRHIKDYEKEIEKLKNEGYSSREIGNKLRFSYKQSIHNDFIEFFLLVFIQLYLRLFNHYVLLLFPRQSIRLL